MVIFKFNLKLTDEIQTITMPAFSKIVHTEMQHGKITAWFMCDSEEEPTESDFKIVGTGHKFGNEFEYVGTCLDGMFVWHILELVE
jgi:hypothetical protein